MSAPLAVAGTVAAVTAVAAAEQAPVVTAEAMSVAHAETPAPAADVVEQKPVENVGVASEVAQTPAAEPLLTPAVVPPAPEAVESIAVVTTEAIQPTAVEVPAFASEPVEVKTSPEPELAEPMPAALPIATAAVQQAPVVDVAPVSIEQSLASSGLVMVETSASKAQAWAPEQVEPETQRPRRRRPAPVQVEQEPLVMVETQK